MKYLVKILMALLVTISVNLFSNAVLTETKIPVSQSLVNNSTAAEDKLYPIDHGFIDRTGKIIIKLPPNHYSFRGFSEGLAAIRMPHVSIAKEPGLGYIDRTGKIVIPPKFIDWEGLRGGENFAEGLAAFVSPIPDRQGRYLTGYMNKTGKVVIPAKFADNPGNFVKGMALVKVYNKSNQQGETRYAFIDRQGKILFEKPKTFTVTDYSVFSEGLAPVQINEQWGFINQSGKLVIPANFINLRHNNKFSDGLAPVGSTEVCGKGSQYGYIDRTGKFVIPAKFSQARSFSEGLAAVKVDNGDKSLWGYIDQTGNYVIPPTFFDVFPEPGDFHEGLAAVSIKKAKSVTDNSLTGFIDRTGKFVIPPQFNQGCGDFSQGLAYCHNVLFDSTERSKVNSTKFGYKGGKYGYIDRQGKFVWEKNMTEILNCVQQLYSNRGHDLVPQNSMPR
jgi:WG containing repeat